MNKIFVCQSDLMVNDYKIIKTAEIIIKEFIKQNPGIELPYNINELIDERNKLRNEINRLQEEKQD